VQYDKEMSPRVGTLLIIVSSAAFGAMAIFARFAYAEGVDPISLLALRFSIAAAALWALMLARRLPVPRGKTLAGLIGMGGALYVVQAFTYFTAITMAPAGLVALLLYLYPAMVTAAAVLLLGERMTAVKAAALALALAGTAITIGPSAGGRPLGVGGGGAGAGV
jgi:drug/metabolite transporter (DMT)-like permease